MQSTSFILVGACLLAASARAQTQPPEPEAAETVYPIVITPTRLSQSLADVPASVTVITAETLQRYGIRSVPEALRFVPGMAVTLATGPDYQISYHGTNTLSPRRMNVFIDGISVYRPAFSEVIWSQLPVTVEDIDRIEVTRGPNSAAYGPNSMLAIVNIVTKHPRDVERAYGSVTVGTQSSAEITARAAFTLGPSAVSATISSARDSGFDELAQDRTGHDSLRVNRLSIRSQTKVGELGTLDLQASVAQGTAEIPFIDNFQQNYPDRHFRDSYIGGAWVQQFSPTHELQFRFNHARQRGKQSWRTCLPTVALLPELFNLWRANPLYANAVIAGQLPTGGSAADNALALAAIAAIRQLGAGALAPTCGTTNQDALQSRTDLELQDTYVVSERLRVVGGLGAREQRGESQTFLGGSASSSIQWLFGNVEARPLPWLTLNAGGYLERNSLSPSTFSPRVAANVRLSPSQTVRIVVSKGTRSPDIQEQRTNWTYTLENLDPPLRGSQVGRFYQSRVGPGNLVSERITSREIGYLLNVQRYGLLLDARVFDDNLTSLISERTNLAGLTPTNNGSVELRGAELQVGLQWSPRWSAFANYAYLENRGATNLLERTQYSRHSGSLGLSHDVGAGWRGSLAYYGASGDGYQESRYGRTDLTVSKAGELDGSKWQSTLGLRRLDTPLTMYSIGSEAPLFSRLSSRLQAFVQFSVRLP